MSGFTTIFLANRNVRLTLVSGLMLRLVFAIFIGLSLPGKSNAGDKLTDIPRTKEFQLEMTGRAHPNKKIEILPQSKGTVIFVVEKLGQRVSKSDVLLKIDPKVYQYALDRVQAKLENSRTELHAIEAELTRIQVLVDKKLATSSKLYTLAFARTLAKGVEKEALANEKKAALNLSQTVVKSPIDGFISQINADLGDYVGHTGAPVFVVLNYDPIEVFFEMDQEIDRQIYKEILQNKVQLLEVKIRFRNGEIYKTSGTYIGSSHQINQETGNIIHQALFANHDRLITPGSTVTVIMKFQWQSE
jgi:RND family efflux transporter MFP subunit